MEFRKHTLKNGLQVIAECNPRAFCTSLGFFVNTGSRDEVDANWGVSHFLEHMTFKGTPRRSAEDVNRELDEIGSSSNAYTSQEQTVYYATVLEEYQDRAVDLLCDMMRPALRSDDFEMEKQVILEEIAKYEDEPPFNANEIALAAHFGQHPLARNVLGTNASVTGLTPESMRAYFDLRYSPGNMTLVGSGNVNFDRLVELADQYCGGWQHFDTHRDIRPAVAHCAFQSIEHELATQLYAVQVCDGPAGESDDRYAARLLGIVLGDDSGSRLYWDLVETGRAEYAAMEYVSFQGHGVFMTFLSCQPDDAAENLRHIQSTWRGAMATGITEAELQQAKNKLCAHIILSSERASSRLFAVGNNWIKRQQYQTVRDVVDAYQRVTLTDIRRILDQYSLVNHTTVAISPETIESPY